MRVLFVMFAVQLSTTAAMACSLMPGFEIPYKNRALVNVANKLGADLSAAQITVEDYKHAFAWKFQDAGFQCHDSNTVTMKVSLKYANRWNAKQACLAKVDLTEVSAPEVKGGPVVVKTDMKELFNTCK